MRRGEKDQDRSRRKLAYVHMLHMHTLMVLSLDPVANHSLLGSTAMQRTQPKWPLITLISFHGGCHSGLTDCRALRGTSCCVPLLRTRACVGRTEAEARAVIQIVHDKV